MRHGVGHRLLQPDALVARRAHTLSIARQRASEAEAARVARLAA